MPAARSKINLPACIDGKHAALAYMQVLQKLKHRAVFGGNGGDDDFDGEKASC